MTERFKLEPSPVGYEGTWTNDGRFLVPESVTWVNPVGVYFQGGNIGDVWLSRVGHGDGIFEIRAERGVAALERGAMRAEMSCTVQECRSDDEGGLIIMRARLAGVVVTHERLHVWPDHVKAPSLVVAPITVGNR